MRNCPKCGALTISRLKLALQGYVPGIVAACSSCQSMVDFKGNDGLISYIISEWILLALVILTSWYFDMFWLGVLAFIVWRVTRICFKVKGPLINN